MIVKDRRYIGGMAGRTIQDVIDSGDTIIAWCHRSTCRHNQAIDFIKLRDKFGAMHDDLVPKLKCSKCGGKHTGLTVQPKGTSKAGSPMGNWGAMPGGRPCRTRS
ncbi:hypothetical protein [Mesorhizobium sp.]|uniref:hypothetical protein n=1 Tax=Mesorhizobium sp. TaxID=1871066 RepID=UPI00262FF7D6|nr:hypothetical protein [Mesorhizobium sp.]